MAPNETEIVAGEGANHGHRSTEQLYRIVGKVRLLLFWISAEDVGGARVSCHIGQQGRSCRC